MHIHKFWCFHGGDCSDCGSIPAEYSDFIPDHRIQTGRRNHLASYPIGSEGSSQGAKQSGREGDQSPPSSA
jgi:hypothetical protein